jgi:hypothetical protein
LLVEEVREMNNELDIIRRIEVLEQIGGELCPTSPSPGTDEFPVDDSGFHRWRIDASKLLFTSLGASNYYYQCFWKTVSKPCLRDVREGLHLLALVRHELEEIFPKDPPFCPVSDAVPAEEFVSDH